MITSETKKSRAFMARYIRGVINNYIYDDDIRQAAMESGIEQEEIVNALSYWQSVLDRAGANI